MATAFGTNAWMGFAEESTFKTPVAATKWLNITEEALKGEHSFISKPTLASPSASQKTRSKKNVSGTVKANLGYEGFERIFKHALGSVASADVGDTYSHTFTLATALPTGLTVEINRDAAAIGGSSSFQYAGCQIDSLTIRQEVESIAEIEVSFLGSDFSNIAVSTPTFPTFHQVDWEHIAQFSYGGTAIKARSFEFTISNALADDRYILGARTRIGLGRSGPREVTGKFEAEFDSLTTYALYRDLSEGPNVLQVIWSNGLATTEAKTIILTAPKCLMTAGEPSVSDAGPVYVTYEFQAYQLSAANDEVSIVIGNSLASA